MSIVKLRLDLNKEYRIVLEGGGAKGAYQVGAWRALREAGIQVKGVAGISVDALNGTFTCTGDLEKVERIWESVGYSRVMDVDDELMERLREFSPRDTSSLISLNVGELMAEAIRVLKDGGSGVAPLRVLTRDVVNEEKIRNLGRELYVVTYPTSDRHPLIANIKGVPEGVVADLLMASAYLIGLRQERLGGKYYMDGDGISSVPMNVLLGRGYKDVIVPRIYGYDVDTEEKLEVPGGVNLYYMAPRKDSGSLLGFDRCRARKNMSSGYFDGKRMLHGLAGRAYYIDAPEGKPYYSGKMMSKIQSLLFYMRPELKMARETKTGREVQKETITGYRVYTEQIFPWLAKELKLREEWDCKEFYLSILEDLAKQYRISRFKIYTVEEFLRLIHRKAGTAALKAMIPVPDSGTQVQYIMRKDA